MDDAADANAGNAEWALGAALGAAWFFTNPWIGPAFEARWKTSIRQPSESRFTRVFALKIHVSPVRFRPCPLKDSRRPRGLRGFLWSAAGRRKGSKAAR
jgi:hypothetical protein